MTAIACAGAMVVTGMNIDMAGMETEASSTWAWNTEYSESGYKKVSYAQLTATADSEDHTGETKSVDSNGSAVGGEAEHVVDGNCRRQMVQMILYGYIQKQ